MAYQHHEDGTLSLDRESSRGTLEAHVGGGA
jgi:hypothetical protein